MTRRDDPFTLTLDGMPSTLEFAADSLKLESAGYDGTWPHYTLRYNVTIRGEEFGYGVGTGHALPMPDGWGHSMLLPRRVKRKGWTPGPYAKSVPLDWKTWLESGKAHPDIALLDVLLCLVGDQEAGLMDFREFCAEFGYTGSPADAYETWHACQENARKLQRILSTEELLALEKAREDW